MWFKKSKPIEQEAEIDIEHLPICAVERNGDETVFMRADEGVDIWIKCSVEQHNTFVKRFRLKLRYG